MKEANGFTLVELLAAMVAGSFLLASLSWTVSTLARRLPVKADTIRDQQLEAVAPAIVQMLEQAAPPSGGKKSFSGDARGLSAIVPPPMSAAGSGPLRLSLRVGAAGGGEGLYAAFAPIDPAAPFPPEAAGERLLAGGFRSIGFEYVESRQPQPRLPRLISLRFTSPDGDIRRITATPRLDSDGSCRFDPISMTCRP